MSGLYEVALFIFLYSGVVISSLWMTLAQKPTVSEASYGRLNKRSTNKPAA